MYVPLTLMPLMFGDVLKTYSISLRPTNEIGEDGWQFFLHCDDLDLAEVAQSEERIFEIIAPLIPLEINFTKVLCANEYRYVLYLFDTPSMRFHRLL
jgi:hypothetical protein